VRYIEVIEIQAEVQLVLRALEYRSLMHKARAIENIDRASLFGSGFDGFRIQYIENARLDGRILRS
jgi:hypothetical protein